MQPLGVGDDPRYKDGSGSDEITYKVPLAAIPRAAKVAATLYYQAIPPSYLQDRFTTADGYETQRLYYLASHLATSLVRKS
jgi:phosphoenolpyruvate carboxylase